MAKIHFNTSTFTAHSSIISTLINAFNVFFEWIVLETMRTGNSVLILRFTNKANVNKFLLILDTTSCREES
jgi:hypothetical protein